MVNHEPSHSDAPAYPGAPVPRPQDPRSDPFADETSDSIWEQVAPRQATPTGIDSVPRNDVPASLRPGANYANPDDDDENVWAEARNQPMGASQLGHEQATTTAGVNRSQTNPFLKKKAPEAWTEPTQPPPQLPPLPTESFGRMGLGETSTNPWQPPAGAQNDHVVNQQQPQPQIPNGADSDPWADTSAAPPPPLKAPPAVPSPAVMSLPSEEGSAWDEEPLAQKEDAPPRPPMTAMSDELIDEQHVWDDLGSANKGKGKAGDAQLDDWNLIDAEPSSSQANPPVGDQPEEKPPLPARNMGESARWVPTRQPVDGTTETYQVKNIRWHDPHAGKDLRTSPILVQNANGPCPLVALVNALTLTTPADVPDTALVNVLRSREQVSLNLLLDAVFDELMSPRRTDSEDALPDVGDLYAFLQSLHTGMNVNPRFIPTPEMVNAYKRTSLTHLHPTERGDLIPGTFENTNEMSLYATFSIPLIHGWLPPRSEVVYSALERQAASYEDVQNLLFREEELEQKLMSPTAGLSEEEQQLYQDILTIKSFLSISATQLTPWGIEVIGKAIRPGTFAILFRNDHFSTLYCHPDTMQLLSLVTDAGYRTHDEVVWESLIDVNGERSEFLSGDYRPVGSGDLVGPSSSGANYSDQGGEWSTVQNTRGKGRQEEETHVSSNSHEQEDRDLALALQLQEEEEQRHREEENRRHRESILSEQYIEQQARQPVPSVRGARGGARGGPVRGGRGGGRGGVDLVPSRQSSNSVNVPVTVGSTTGITTGTTTGVQPRQASQPAQMVRPLIPPRRQGVTRVADEGGDEAPPSYEQAAHDRQYVPPAGHANHAGSTADISRETTRTSTTTDSGPARTGQRYPGQAAAGRRPPPSQGAVPGQQGRDRDCVVM